MSRSVSVLLSVGIYVITLISIGLILPFLSHYPVLIRVAIADLVGTSIVFIFSAIFNNSSMYDPYWSVKPFVIACFYFMMEPISQATLIEIITLLFIAMYSLRLTANFYKGWHGLKDEDWRYKNFRIQFPRIYWVISFFGIHLFPSVMVYLGCLPMFYIFKEPVLFPGLATFGLILLNASVLLAFIADEQLRKHKRELSEKGQTLKTGLWAKSRHPNYLGEILSWWGIFIIALASGWQYWWTGAGAFSITLMFVFISIPMMEKHSLKRRKDYKEYKVQTPKLIFWK